jgi:hypothetical protein
MVAHNFLKSKKMRQFEMQIQNKIPSGHIHPRYGETHVFFFHPHATFHTQPPHTTLITLQHIALFVVGWLLLLLLLSLGSLDGR